jgi:hypothetical protein
MRPASISVLEHPKAAHRRVPGDAGAAVAGPGAGGKGARPGAGQPAQGDAGAPLAAACVALAEHAVDAGPVTQTPADLAGRFEYLRDLLPLVARIYAEILAEVAAAPGPYKAWLAERGGWRWQFTKPDPDSASPGSGRWKAWTPSLATGRPREDAAARRRVRPSVWSGSSIRRREDIAVAEQSAKGRDGWTDGRAVAMKRLHEQDPRLDYLTPQDRTALRTIRKEDLELVRRGSFRVRPPRARSPPWSGIRPCSTPAAGAATRTRVLSAGTAGQPRNAAATASRCRTRRRNRRCSWRRKPGRATG